MAVTEAGSSETGVAAGIGVCASRGFSAGTAAADIRDDGDLSRDDIAVVMSDHPCAGAGVFTRNLVKAAPVVISQLTLRRGTPIYAVIANSGNANACTGAQGLRDALRMCALTAGALGRDPVEVVVCSTGVIGRPLPMERVAEGLRVAARSLSRDSGELAARAIMTTDTVPKMASASFTVEGVEHRVGGMAKGAGMIHPDMATLLAIVTTDANIAAPDLQALLVEVAESSFNSITVDGDTSTNDTLFALANGAAGGPALSPGGAGFALPRGLPGGLRVAGGAGGRRRRGCHQALPGRGQRWPRRRRGAPRRPHRGRVAAGEDGGPRGRPQLGAGGRWPWPERARTSASTGSG